MNERIKQLAKQAGMTDDKFGMFFANDKHNEDGVDLQKFAELIVKECMGICEQQRVKIINNPNDPSWTEHLAECQTTMEQTFLRI